MLTAAERQRLKLELYKGIESSKPVGVPKGAWSGLVAQAIACAGLGRRATTQDAIIALGEINDAGEEQSRRFAAVADASGRIAAAMEERNCTTVDDLAAALGMPLGPELLAALGVRNDLAAVWRDLNALYEGLPGRGSH